MKINIQEKNEVARIGENPCNWFYFMAVTLYLSCVGLFLLITRRVKLGVPLPSMIVMYVWRKLRLIFNKRANGMLTDIKPELGYCYLTPVPKWIMSDSNGRSNLKLLENENPLGPAHSLHDHIRSLGMGRYSHWGGYIYFSTSDNSDPRTNGRTYIFSE
jgi:hypothetical protein